MKAKCPQCGRVIDCVHGKPEEYQCECGGDMFAYKEPETCSFETEIMRTGNWKGLDWDENDIDKVIENFEKGVAKVGLKITKDGAHNGKPLTMPGGAALGWVDGLVRVKDRLVARFKQVPKKIGELIANGALDQKSIEGSKNFKTSDGGQHGRTLTNVLFFGVDGLPAVHGLSDLVALYKLQESKPEKFGFAYTEDDFKPSGGTQDGVKPDTTKPESKEGVMKVEVKEDRLQILLKAEAENEIVKAAKEAAETKATELELKVESTSKTLVETEKSLKEFKDKEDVARSREVTEFAHKLVEDGKIKQSEEEGVVELIKAKKDEDRLEYQKKLETSPSVFGEKVTNPDPEEKTDNVWDKTHKNALAYQKKNPGTPYLMAREKVGA